MTRQFPINFRAFVVVAVAIASAVLCVLAYMHNTVLGVVLGCVHIVALFCCSAVYVIKCVKKTTALHKTIAFCAAAVLSLSAFVVGIVTYKNWSDNYKYQGYGTVYGRVCYIDSRTGDYKIGLEDLYINGDSVDGILQLSVKVDSDVNIAEIVRCGDRLKFYSYISVNKLYRYGSVDGTAYRTNIRFSAKASGNDVEVIFGEPSAMETLLGGMRDKFVENMGVDYGNIVYAMITGDKHGLYSGITDSFSSAGLGHIMAVSGLHVGFMAAIFNFLLRKANKKLRFGIVTAFLILYTVIADFSPSVIRAVIMTEVYMAAQFVGGRRDILSSLCFSFSVILAVRPLYLFEIGFQMSFGAIFGIAMFCNSISRTLSRIRLPKTKVALPKKVTDGVAASVSVQAGIVPIEIYHFKNIQIFSLLVNIFFIPYVSVVFVATVFMLPISFIPGCGGVLIASKYLMTPLDFVSNGISALRYSTFNVYATQAVFLCYPIMFVASEYFIMDKFKLSVILMSVFACVAFCLISGSANLSAKNDEANESVKSFTRPIDISYVEYESDLSFETKYARQNTHENADTVRLFEINADCIDNPLYSRYCI